MDVAMRLAKAVSAPGHAYILAGDGDLLSVAKSFAKALQCDDADNGISCGQCLSCRVFESGNHPDVIYVKATKTKAIGVDDVRSQIVLPMSEKPFRYRYKIFIIDQVLTPQAQNALLKTIEEPASFGIFLFLTESLELYLPTVLSRCIALKMNENEAEVSDEMRQFAVSVANRVYNMDILDVFSLYTQFEKWKDSIQVLLDELYISFRNQLPDNREALTRLDAIASAKKALQQNGNFQMTIEAMLLKCI